MSKSVSFIRVVEQSSVYKCMDIRSYVLSIIRTPFPQLVRIIKVSLYFIVVSQPYSVACIFAYSVTIILPIMLALCLMLSGTYYAQNYAGIIGWYLYMAPSPYYCFTTRVESHLHIQLVFAHY